MKETIFNLGSSTKGAASPLLQGRTLKLPSVATPGQAEVEHSLSHAPRRAAVPQGVGPLLEGHAGREHVRVVETAGFAEGQDRPRRVVQPLLRPEPAL